jgi:hypothetical protein
MIAQIVALRDACRVVHAHASVPIGHDDLKGMPRR